MTIQVLSELVSSSFPGGTTWVWQWLVRGSLFLALLFPLTALLRGAPSSARHLAWTAGLGIALAFPLASAAVPQWHIRIPVAVAGLFGRTESGSADAVAMTQLEAEPASSDPGSPASGPAMAGADVTHSGVDAPPTVSAPIVDASTVTANGQAGGASANAGDMGAPTAPVDTWSWSTVLRTALLAWALGALVLLLSLGVSMLRMRRIVSRATPVEDWAWTRTLLEVSDRLGLSHPPRLLVSRELSVPVTSGILSPAVILPPASADWSEERMQTVLCHELAHVRRRDLLSHLLGHVACALYWFQPLAWSAARRMRAESERSCDDLVLSLGTRASTYADHLLQIATHGHGRVAPAAAIPMAEPREFERRLLSILAPGVRRGGIGFGRSVALVAMVFLCAVPLFALTPTQSPPQVPPALPAQPAPSALWRVTPAPEGPPAPMSPEPAAGATQAAPSVAEPAPTPSTLPALGTDPTPSGPAPSVTPAPGSPPSPPPPAGAQMGLTPSARAGLITALADSDAEVRRTAVWALAQQQDTVVVRALTTALDTDPDPMVREMSAWSMAQQGRRNMTPASLDALGRAVLEDESVEVRVMVAWALGDLELPGTEAALERALATDANEEVRYNAAWALGQVGSESSKPALADALTASEERVRSSAAWALGQIGTGPAPESLLAAVADASPQIREVAAWALGEIEDPAGVAVLARAVSDTEPGVRAAAMWALGQMDDSPVAIEALTAALQDPDPEVRRSAARALGGSSSSMSRQRPMQQPRPTP